MNIEEIIAHKRDKRILKEEEIKYFINNYVNGKIKDYQASSLLMAIYLNGMTGEEIANLTHYMQYSGDVWDLSEIGGCLLDKHSTGGVGDKVSLIIGPIIASLGGHLAKMSGRGLGHTGGTLDKMESIPGMKINLTKEQFIKQIKEIGMAIIGQDDKLNPADKKMYALRDVTGTVGSIPLIASSIMSKKLATGADCILLDVKYGSGAFMQNVEDATILAKTMVSIGKLLGKKVEAEITYMDQPLGNAVGNSLEIKEVIEVLHNKGPKDIREVCISSSIELLTMAEIYNDKDKCREDILEVLSNGKAFDKFVEFAKAQGGNIDYILNPSLFETAKNQIEIKSTQEGYISKIDAKEIGLISMHLGGGRLTMEDTIDMSAGVILNKKIGDYVKEGELLCTLHTNHDKYEHDVEDAYRAFETTKEKVVFNEKYTDSIIK